MQSCLGVEGNAYAGESAEALEEGGVEREAKVGQGTELRGVVWVLRGEHASGCSGSLGERVAAVEHGDAKATMVEFEGE